MTKDISIMEPENLHKTFGGLIFQTDFDTTYGDKYMGVATRIISDQSFDERCRRNIMCREAYKDGYERE